MLKRIIEIILGYKGIFTLERATADSGWPRQEVRARLARLEREGLIRRVRETAHNNGEPGAPIRRISYVAMKGLKKRLEEMTFQRPGTKWDAIWRTMRVMRRFTRTDLVQLTGASEANVKYYTTMLKRAGYLGRAGRTTWILLKNTGPQRPRISKKVMKRESSRQE